MILFPAIDLKDRKVVRLYRGDFGTVHQVADDPLTVARAFYDAGARHIHMVDLDGARSGVRENFPLIYDVIQSSGLKVELGGGIKTELDVITVGESGVDRLVIGSAAVSHPELVQYALGLYGDRVAVGVDCLNGRVRTAGWEKDSGLDSLDFVGKMADMGVKNIIFTDIATDGMLSGPPYGQLAALQRRAPGCRITASGGVARLDDIKRLRDMGLYAAIIGKAYYAGTIDLAAAVREAGEQE